MSKFSAYLKELLEQRGEPIARIAKNTGLERTSIHKALKDERMLPYTALRQLGQYLQLTLPQMRELNQYYEMLLRGEDLYYIQKTICGLLADLSQMHFSCQGPVLIPERAAEAPASPGIVYGRPQVEAAIQAVLQWETEVEGAELELYLPPACRVPDCLLPLWRADAWASCALIPILRGFSWETRAPLLWAGRFRLWRSSAVRCCCCPLWAHALLLLLFR